MSNRKKFVEEWTKLPIKLAKVGTAGLVGVGIIYLLASKSKFEYNQDSFVNLSDQFENYIGYDLDIDKKNILDSLRDYEIAYDNYKASNGDEVTLRKELINSTSGLKKAAYDILRLKACDSVGCSRDAKMYIDDLTNKVDGPYYEIILDDNGANYTLKMTDNELFSLVNNIDVINGYQGDGTNPVWEDAIKGYGKTTEKIYNGILKAAKMKDDGFKIVESSKSIMP